MFDQFDQQPPPPPHQPPNNPQGKQTYNQQPPRGNKPAQFPIFRTKLDSVGEFANESIAKIALVFSTGFGCFGIGYIFDGLLDTNLTQFDSFLQDTISYAIGAALCYMADFKGINGMLPVAISQFAALSTGKFAFSFLAVFRATLFALIAGACLVFSIIASGKGFAIAGKDLIQINGGAVNVDSLNKEYNQAVKQATKPLDAQMSQLEKAIENDALQLLGKSLYDSYKKGNSWAINKAKELGIESVQKKYASQIQDLQAQRIEILNQQKELHEANVQTALDKANLDKEKFDNDKSNKYWFDWLIGYAPTVISIFAVCIRAISIVYLQLYELDGNGKIKDSPYTI